MPARWRAKRVGKVKGTHKWRIHRNSNLVGMSVVTSPASLPIWCRKKEGKLYIRGTAGDQPFRLFRFMPSASKSSCMYFDQKTPQCHEASDQLQNVAVDCWAEVSAGAPPTARPARRTPRPAASSSPAQPAGCAGRPRGCRRSAAQREWRSAGPAGPPGRR